jgi:hypothetical protein
MWLLQKTYCHTEETEHECIGQEGLEWHTHAGQILLVLCLYSLRRMQKDVEVIVASTAGEVAERRHANPELGTTLRTFGRCDLWV